MSLAKLIVQTKRNIISTNKKNQWNILTSINGRTSTKELACKEVQ